MWNSTIYHKDLEQNAVFHNFSRQIALGLAKPLKKNSKITYRKKKRPVGSHFWLLCLNEHE